MSLDVETALRLLLVNTIAAVGSQYPIEHDWRPFMKCLFSVCCATLILSSVSLDDMTTTFDEKPEPGIPIAAQLQNNKRLAKPLLWGDVFAGKFESANIRYFDAETWETEKQVKQYLIEYLECEDTRVHSQPPWAQGVGVPEIECSIRFKDDYRKSTDRKFRYGKLLIWKTVACFRDANGTWHFLTNGDYFHLHHPEGDLELRAELKDRAHTK